MDQKLFNKILLIILIIETIFLAGTIGYRIGAANAEEVIHHVTIQIDPSMLEIEEADEPGAETEPAIAAHIEPSYTEEEIEYIAKTIWGEARGLSVTEQSAVAWCILNRVDSENDYMPNDIISVITQKNQFVGYQAKHPVTEEHYELAKDVLDRWDREKAGETNVGRTLPKEYLWFVANSSGTHNIFSDKWRNGNTWDWSLDSPYT